MLKKIRKKQLRSIINELRNKSMGDYSNRRYLVAAQIGRNVLFSIGVNDLEYMLDYFNVKSKRWENLKKEYTDAGYEIKTF